MVSLETTLVYMCRRITGEVNVLRALPQLEKAAAQWGQSELAQELRHYAAIPGRVPLLVLAFSEDASCTELQGAVFLYAYCSPIFGIRLLSNADRFGRIGVFGPEQFRNNIAVACTRFLLATGAALVRLTFASERHLSADNLADPGQYWTVRSRTAYERLALHSTLDSTLSQFGKRTRRNIREVMRRCVSDLGCVFHPTAQTSIDTFMALSRRAARPSPPREARRRYASALNASGFLCGIKSANGQWLSMAGGRLSGNTVVLEWQMNDLAFSRYSPSLLMRAFLIDHFGGRDFHSIFFEGGTSHSISRYFQTCGVHDLRARRETLWLKILQQIMQSLLPKRAVTRILFGHG